MKKHKQHYNKSHNKKSTKHFSVSTSTFISVILVSVFAVCVFSVYQIMTAPVSHPATLATAHPVEKVAYTGKVYHIFFHSLVVYPELAFKNDSKGNLYKEYMVTRDQFTKILDSLYARNFVLIDIHSLYTTKADGTIVAKKLFLPKGKKPLIISLDDLNYYSFMKGRGFADKLVLDSTGNVATEVVTPEGKTVVTDDGDVVPILDHFVAQHPDFSVDGNKGVIALTGFEGVLGYRTEADAKSANPDVRVGEILHAKEVIVKLKATGWQFASHSYTHDHSFQTGSVSLEYVKYDTEKWKAEVGHLVGPTDIFIGPFGQVFSVGDPRQEYLLASGFKMLDGVGMDLYLHYFSDRIIMDRADIDGFRIANNPKALEPYFETGELEK